MIQCLVCPALLVPLVALFGVVGYPKVCWILALWFLRRPGVSGRTVAVFYVETWLLPLIRLAVDAVAFRSGLFATAKYATQTTTHLPFSLAFSNWYGVAVVALDFPLVHTLSLVGLLDRAPKLTWESCSACKSFLLPRSYSLLRSLGYGFNFAASRCALQV